LWPVLDITPRAERFSWAMAGSAGKQQTGPGRQHEPPLRENWVCHVI
jgi:hypothetical protein